MGTRLLLGSMQLGVGMGTRLLLIHAAGGGSGNKATIDPCWGWGLGTRLLLIHAAGGGHGNKATTDPCSWGWVWEQGYY